MSGVKNILFCLADVTCIYDVRSALTNKLTLVIQFFANKEEVIMKTGWSNCQEKDNELSVAN